jgi:glucose-6-phosphate isomerase
MNELFVPEAVRGRSVGSVPGAIYEGVRQAYIDAELPHYCVELSDLSAREIGAFMGLHMVMIMYLAHLFGVNAFDQPAVESYKQKTRDILANG